VTDTATTCNNGYPRIAWLRGGQRDRANVSERWLLLCNARPAVVLGEYLIEYGEIIGYALAGVIGLVGLLIIQLLRRRSDLKKARVAVRLASYSIVAPRPGPIAVKGVFHQTADERWLSCHGQRVELSGAIEVVRGTRARWQGGTRMYSLKEGEDTIAIGVMSRAGDGGWRLVSSPGEAGIQLYAAEPRPAPAPLFPWRAPLILAVCGGLGFGALYGAGTFLVDVPRADACSETSVQRLQFASALPLVRADALDKLAHCPTQ
jgi:hypothetical protein